MNTTALTAMIVPFLTPKILGGAFGALTLTGIGYGAMKWSESKSGLAFRKKVATKIRNKANKAVLTIDKAVNKMEYAAE